MCGRFAQYQSRDAYFDALGASDTDYLHDPEPIGRYNVAPGTSVLLLNERGGGAETRSRLLGLRPGVVGQAAAYQRAR